MVEITVSVTKFSHNKFGESVQSRENFKEIYYTHSMASSMLSKIMDVVKFRGDDLQDFAFTVMTKNI